MGVLKKRLMEFREKCLGILLSHRRRSGCFFASNSFPPYQAAWLRDNYWCAKALDDLGYFDEAREVFRWIHRTILGRRPNVERLLKLDPEDPDFYSADSHIGSKFREDGVLSDGDQWGQRQYDGVALYLHGLAYHVESSGHDRLWDECRESIELAREYLLRVWRSACYDAWEEFGTHHHSYTLYTIYAGLSSLPSAYREASLDNLLLQVLEEFRKNFCNGWIRKMRGSGASDAFGLDGSSLWIISELGFDDEKIAEETVKMAVQNLGSPGPRRYFLEREADGSHYDRYFGGGRWLILSCALGQCLFDLGDVEGAVECLQWCYSQRSGEGYLPEQSINDVQDRRALAEWVEKTEGPASPLAWSHAAYLRLYSRLEDLLH